MRNLKEKYLVEMRILQIGIGINSECDSTEDVRNLIFGIINEANSNGFAVDSVHIDGIEIFRSDKGFIKDLATRN